ncbi:hypothetical protein COOONC_23977 [Cooperia oncophora]
MNSIQVLQWFGNLVTMKWWDDLWLNEGFAVLMEHIAVDGITHGVMNAKDFFVVDTMESAFEADSLASSIPLIPTIDRMEEISEAFNTITYKKGASLLAMLMAVMGG